jgi:hypothetical protein
LLAGTIRNHPPSNERSAVVVVVRKGNYFNNVRFRFPFDVLKVNFRSKTGEELLNQLRLFIRHVTVGLLFTLQLTAASNVIFIKQTV